MTTATRHATTPASPAPDWTRALCAETDPTLFFPEGRGAQITNAITDAKRICGWCPITRPCLEWALDTGQNTGVWGGLDEDERRDLIRVPDSTMTMCLNRQSWIEEQLGLGRSQKSIADELDVDHGVLNRAIQRFQDERAEVAEAVKAA